MFEGCSLASALRTEHNVDLWIGCQQFVGVVVAAVGDPHDTEFVFRIVEREGVLHLLSHHVFLVVSADHQGHGGQVFICRHGCLKGKTLQQPFQPDDDV